MKNMVLKVAVTTAIMMMGDFKSFAGDFGFEDVLARGSGCPIGTTEVIKSPDGKNVSILFSDMVVEVPQFDGNNENDLQSDDHRVPMSRFDQTISHKICNIVANAEIPEGHRVDSLQVSVDFRGSTIMDPGTQALFHSQFVSWNGPNRVSRRAKDMLVRKVWRFGDADEEWYLSNTKTIDVNSNCSRRRDSSFQFELMNILKAGIRPEYSHSDVSAYLSLDTADLAGKISVKVFTSPCGRGNHRGGSLGPGSHRGNGSVSRGRHANGNRCPRSYVFSDRMGRCIRL